jgi:hypothetical protein
MERVPRVTIRAQTQDGPLGLFGDRGRVRFQPDGGTALQGFRQRGQA